MKDDIEKIHKRSRETGKKIDDQTQGEPTAHKTSSNPYATARFLEDLKGSIGKEPKKLTMPVPSVQTSDDSEVGKLGSQTIDFLNMSKNKASSAKNSLKEPPMMYGYSLIDQTIDLIGTSQNLKNLKNVNSSANGAVLDTHIFLTTNFLEKKYTLETDLEKLRVQSARLIKESKENAQKAIEKIKKIKKIYIDAIKEWRNANTGYGRNINTGYGRSARTSSSGSIDITTYYNINKIIKEYEKAKNDASTAIGYLRDILDKKIIESNPPPRPSEKVSDKISQPIVPVQEVASSVEPTEPSLPNYCENPLETTPLETTAPTTDKPLKSITFTRVNTACLNKTVEKELLGKRYYYGLAYDHFDKSAYNLHGRERFWIREIRDLQYFPMMFKDGQEGSIEMTEGILHSIEDKYVDPEAKCWANNNYFCGVQEPVENVYNASFEYDNESDSLRSPIQLGKIKFKAIRNPPKPKSSESTEYYYIADFSSSKGFKMTRCKILDIKIITNSKATGLLVDLKNPDDKVKVKDISKSQEVYHLTVDGETKPRRLEKPVYLFKIEGMTGGKPRKKTQRRKGSRSKRNTRRKAHSKRNNRKR